MQVKDCLQKKGLKAYIGHPEVESREENKILIKPIGIRKSFNPREGDQYIKLIQIIQLGFLKKGRELQI